jgi:hypothetical protein
MRQNRWSSSYVEAMPTHARRPMKTLDDTVGEKSMMLWSYKSPFKVNNNWDSLQVQRQIIIDPWKGKTMKDRFFCDEWRARICPRRQKSASALSCASTGKCWHQYSRAENCEGDPKLRTNESAVRSPSVRSFRRSSRHVRNASNGATSWLEKA